MKKHFRNQITKLKYLNYYKSNIIIEQYIPITRNTSSNIRTPKIGKFFSTKCESPPQQRQKYQQQQHQQNVYKKKQSFKTESYTKVDKVVNLMKKKIPL